MPRRLPAVLVSRANHDHLLVAGPVRPRRDVLLDRSASERGSALVIAVLVVVILTLLGLSFMLAGETESKIARNQRDAAQAGFVAEGAVRMVKKWFDVPAGASAHLVPTVAQMNRALRWVDDTGTGTYVPYASATPPFNVVYRQGTDDPFEKPYRGSAAVTLLGTEAHPDVRISEGGSSGEQTFLATLNAGLFPTFPTPGQRTRVRQIDVYAPPILVVGGQRTRYGIATVKVTADVYQYVGTTNETRIATRIVKAVLNEAPFAGPGGPLQSCVNIDVTGDFAAHWGVVTAVNTMNLNNNLDGKVDSSVPYYDRNWIIARDMDESGTEQLGSPGTATGDDKSENGVLDFVDWINSSGNVEDPWLKFWSEGNVTSGGKAIMPDCAGANCQPAPWFRPNYSTPPVTFPNANDDHSNIIKNVSMGLCPDYDYKFWKEVVLSGCQNCSYYKSDGPGTGTWKLFGQGASTAFAPAVDNKKGLFFFDTDTNTEPVDADNNGTYDNVSVNVDLSGQGIATGGFIYLNANVRTTGSGSIPTGSNRFLIAPGEPYRDANNNGKYEPTEWFVDLTYPASLGGGYLKIGTHRVADGFARQDPSVDAAADGKYSAGINVYGVFYISGTLDAQGNWIFFGSVVTKSGMLPNSAGTPGFYFDERLQKGAWPPVELGLLRTVITAWQTDL